MTLSNSKLFSESLVETERVYVSTSIYSYVKFDMHNLISLVSDNTRTGYKVLDVELDYLRGRESRGKVDYSVSFLIDLVWKIEYCYNNNKSLYKILQSVTEDLIFCDFMYDMSDYVTSLYNKVKYNQVFNDRLWLDEEDVENLLKSIENTEFRIESSSSVLCDPSWNIIPLSDYEEYFFNRCFSLYDILPNFFSYRGVNFIKDIPSNKHSILKLLPFSNDQYATCRLYRSGYLLKKSSCICIDIDSFVSDCTEPVKFENYATFEDFTELIRAVMPSKVNFYSDIKPILSEIVSCSNIEDFSNLYMKHRPRSKSVYGMDNVLVEEMLLAILRYIFGHKYFIPTEVLSIVKKYNILFNSTGSSCSEVKSSKFSKEELYLLDKYNLSNYCTEFIVVGYSDYSESLIRNIISGITPITVELFMEIMGKWDAGMYSVD